MIALQQPPQGPGVPLHPVRPADDQDGTVQHLEGTLHLAGEVHMARGVQQGDLYTGQRQHRLLGKNGDARSRSSASVSRKASWWSTRPSRFSVPQVYSIPSDKVVFPASTWAKIPMTSFLMVPLPVPKTAGRHCPAGPLCSVYSHFRGFSPSNQGQKPMRPSLSLISSGSCLNAPPQTSRFQVCLAKARLIFSRCSKNGFIFSFLFYIENIFSFCYNAVTESENGGIPMRPDP